MANGQSEVSFKAKNPLEAIQDPVVLWTGAGVLAAQFGRAAIYASSRDTFGKAVYRDPQDIKAGIKFVAADNKTELPNARTARLFANVGLVLAGTLLLTSQQGNDSNDLDIFGLGLAGSGAANVVMELFQIYP